jgi:hypothetical protein
MPAKLDLAKGVAYVGLAYAGDIAEDRIGEGLIGGPNCPNKGCEPAYPCPAK